MKWYNYSVAAILLGVMLAGCTKLDTEPTGSTITSKQKEEVIASNPDMISASVSGITAMFSVYCNVLSDDHTDFGYPSIMLALDTRGTDLVGDDIGYNWFSRGLDLISDRTFNYRETRIVWATLYNQIYAANQVVGVMDKAALAAIIDDPEKTPTADESLSMFYLAQALAIRAFDYFNLAQIYQFTYKGHESDPCVPLILDTNANDAAANGCPRSTVQVVYDQIVEDLDLAIKFLGATQTKRADKRYVDEAVAYGLRARVRLVMQDYAGAAADAQAALDATDATPISKAEASKPGFIKMTEPNWMWGIAVAETDRVVTSGIINWPSHMGSLNYGYASVGAWRRISKKLYNSIPATDCRKGWFLDADSMSPNLSAEQQDYVINTAGCPGYTQVKFAPYKNELYSSTNANDIILMRVEELYLLLAEAKARNNDAADAATDLKTFVSTYRDPSFDVAADKDAVIDAVILQRRIELWGEGHSYFDILRLDKGLDRRGAGFDPKYVFNIAPDDPLLIFQIPKAEIEGNQALTDADNNPVGGTPEPVTDTE